MFPFRFVIEPVEISRAESCWMGAEKYSKFECKERRRAGKHAWVFSALHVRIRLLSASPSIVETKQTYYGRLDDRKPSSKWRRKRVSEEGEDTIAEEDEAEVEEKMEEREEVEEKEEVPGTLLPQSALVDINCILLGHCFFFGCAGTDVCVCVCVCGILPHHTLSWEQISKIRFLTTKRKGQSKAKR